MGKRAAARAVNGFAIHFKPSASYNRFFSQDAAFIIHTYDMSFPVHIDSTHTGFKHDIWAWRARNIHNNYPPYGWCAVRFNECLRNSRWIFPE
jgi:hypothetical protein